MPATAATRTRCPLFNLIIGFLNDVIIVGGTAITTSMLATKTVELPSASVWLVTKMIGVAWFSSVSRMRSQVAKPSIPGISTSRKITSKDFSCVSAKAASPLSATSGFPNCNCRALVIARRAIGSSSTTSMRIPPVPASSPAASAPIDQRPDAALKGLNRLGVVVEGLGADAAKCGLKQEALETAVTKRLMDAGLRVVRDSDDDTYLYVNINTVTASAALCVSRYDVTLYSHATAQLTHTTSTVLLQVELLHKGGLTGGGPGVHADGVLKSVLEYVDQFSTRVRDANK